ncbi:MAG: aspartate-semialdehyde dehydrogenase, partial [Thermoplasmata archaeon]|nr:aspartate-semialdehyde dehydrogenase [Thermoplasmata archaeon]
MSDSNKIPSAILGASGYIGQHFARLLARHPRFEVPRLTGGERSEGQRLEEVWQLTEEPPRELAGERFRRLSPAQLQREGVQIVFGAIPSGLAGPVETECRRRGIHVFSNAADHRLDPDVPLLVPEVNAAHLRAIAGRTRGRALLVTNPNCTATGLVLALTPVWALLSPRAVHVTTYQALSGAGYPGVASLSITDNVVPYIPQEEEKVAQESNRILGAVRGGRVIPGRVPFLANCARVAVRDGHLEAVTVEARHRPSLTSLIESWRQFDPLRSLPVPTAPHPPVEMRSQADRPQPSRDRWAGEPERARGMAAVVGRVRWDPPFLRFFVLSHNAVRGGAGGSVLNAELADEL